MNRKTLSFNLIRLSLITISTFSLVGYTKAQSQIGDFVKASAADGNKILQAYANPFLKRHGDGWADGWTYTARHEKFTFKLVSLSAIFVDNSEKTFDASTLGLSSNVRIDGSPINQTFAGGPNTSNAAFDIYGKNPMTGQDQKITTITGPDGMNLNVLNHNVIPTVVTPQIGIGVLPGTEIMIRLLPDVHVGKYAQVTVVGVGAKQTLNNLIFGSGDNTSKTTDMFDLAAYSGYSMEKLSYKLDIEPTDAQKTTSGNQNTNYKNQKVQMKTTDFTVGALISKKILFITPHAGIAYSTSQTTLSAIGTYPVPVVGPTGLSSVSNVDNPFLVTGSHNGMSANIGLNINLFLIKINTEYVISKYNRLNVGLSLYF